MEKKDKLKLNVNNIKRCVAIGLTVVTFASFASCAKKPTGDPVPTSISVDVKDTNEIDVENLDFSQITVVLGKNSNTHDIATGTMDCLERLGVKVYISDATALTAEVTEQAAIENPEDDIIAIAIGGEKNNTGKTVIMANYGDGYIDREAPTVSDSIALMLNSEVSNSTVVHGKYNIYQDQQDRTKTTLEEKIKKSSLVDSRIKTVTIALDEDDSDYLSMPSQITNAIIKYTAMTKKERDTTYLGMLYFHPEFTGSRKYGTDIKASDSNDTIQIRDCKMYDAKIGAYNINNTKK